MNLNQNLNKRIGLLHSLCFKCTNPNCNYDKQFHNSKVNHNKNIEEINLRLFYSMRVLGHGDQVAKFLCGLLNLSKPVTSSKKYSSYLLSTIKEVANETMIKAAKETAKFNNDNHITVSIDGTWQSRGIY